MEGTMQIRLHKQATTTPKVRAAIHASDEPARVLAQRHGTTEQTVWKWRKRDSVEDRSHTPHRLQTTLTPAQEAVAVALRKALLISLDDLLAVIREFLNPNVSRSGLDRCLRRHGVADSKRLAMSWDLIAETFDLFGLEFRHNTAGAMSRFVVSGREQRPVAEDVYPRNDGSTRL